MRHVRPLLHLARADDAAYFRACALQEQVAAQSATSPVARERHDELAMHYRFRSMMLADPCLAPKAC